MSFVAIILLGDRVFHCGVAIFNVVRHLLVILRQKCFEPVFVHVNPLKDHTLVLLDKLIGALFNTAVLQIDRSALLRLTESDLLALRVL